MPRKYYRRFKLKKTLIAFVVALLSSLLVFTPTTARYVFEQSAEFGMIIVNIGGDTNLTDVYDDKDFVVPDGQVSSDNILTLNNGDTNYDGYDTSNRWTNWSSDWTTRTDAKTASIIFEWDDPCSLSQVNVYYFIDNYATRVPSAVYLYYKNLNGEWVSIDDVKETKNYKLFRNQVSFINRTPWNGNYKGVAPASFFVINQQITDATAIKITLEAQTYNSAYNYCVGLIETEIYA